MKTITFVSVLLYCSIVLLLCAGGTTIAQQGEWTVLDAANSRTYNDIECTDPQHCIGIANDGGKATIIRRTMDGGKTWKTVHSFPLQLGTRPLRLHRVAYPSPDLCMVAADSGYIIRTTDGGETWRRQRIDTTAIACIPMLNASTGIAVAAPDRLYRTTDGGETWNQIPFTFSGPGGANNGVYPAPDSIYIMVSWQTGRRWMRSTNGGETWEENSALDGMQGIHFIDGLRGWAAGGIWTGVGDRERDIIVATTDGGRTWTTQIDAEQSPVFGLRDIAMSPSGHGIAVGSAGKFCITTDAGAHWTVDSLGVEQFTAITYPSGGAPIAVTALTGRIIRYDWPASAPEAPAVPPLKIFLYPNPSAGETTLSFSLEAPAEVRASIVSPLGEETSLLERQIVAAGGHSLRWTATGSGLHIVRLWVQGEQYSLPVVVRR